MSWKLRAGLSDAAGYLADEVGGGADAVVVPDLSHGVGELGPLGDVLPHLLHGQTLLLEKLVHFRAGLYPGLVQLHLDAAPYVDLGIPRSFDGDEYGGLVVGHHLALHTVAHRAGHAAKGLEGDHHLGVLVLGSHDVLVDLQVTLAALQVGVVVGPGVVGQLLLVGQGVGLEAQGPPVQVVPVPEEDLGQLQLPYRLLLGGIQPQLVLGALLGGPKSGYSIQVPIGSTMTSAP